MNHGKRLTAVNKMKAQGLNKGNGDCKTSGNVMSSVNGANGKTNAKSSNGENLTSDVLSTTCNTDASGQEACRAKSLEPSGMKNIEETGPGSKSLPGSARASPAKNVPRARKSLGSKTPDAARKQVAAHPSSSHVIFGVKQLEESLGIKNQTLTNIDARTLDKLILQKAFGRNRRSYNSNQAKIGVKTATHVKDSSEKSGDTVISSKDISKNSKHNVQLALHVENTAPKSDSAVSSSSEAITKNTAPKSDSAVSSSSETITTNTVSEATHKESNTFASKNKNLTQKKSTGPKSTTWARHSKKDKSKGRGSDSEKMQDKHIINGDNSDIDISVTSCDTNDIDTMSKTNAQNGNVETHSDNADENTVMTVDGKPKTCTEDTASQKSKKTSRIDDYFFVNKTKEDAVSSDKVTDIESDLSNKKVCVESNTKVDDNIATNVACVSQTSELKDTDSNTNDHKKVSSAVDKETSTAVMSLTDGGAPSQSEHSMDDASSCVSTDATVEFDQSKPVAIGQRKKSMKRKRRYTHLTKIGAKSRPNATQNLKKAVVAAHVQPTSLAMRESDKKGSSTLLGGKRKRHSSGEIDTSDSATVSETIPAKKKRVDKTEVASLEVCSTERSKALLPQIKNSAKKKKELADSSQDDIKYVNTPNGVTYPDLSGLNLPKAGSGLDAACCCRVTGTKVTKVTGLYCQALDTVDGKVFGCRNKVKSTALLRPSPRIPFMSLCDEHHNRLRSHHCCPVCGHFCLKGDFLQCSSDNITHRFHYQCQVLRNGKYYCPHCAEVSQQVGLYVKHEENGLSIPYPPITLTANAKRTAGPTARMSVGGSSNKSANDEVPPSISYNISPSVTISSANLTAGPMKAQLEQALSLLKSGKSKSKSTAKNLYTACKSQDLEKIMALLEEGHDVNSVNSESSKRTALHMAASQGNVLSVHVLVQAGGKVNVSDAKLRSPLMEAAEKGHLEVIKYLTESGATFQNKGEDGMTALHLAARAGHQEAVHFLSCLPEMDINCKDEGGWTPLIWAAENVHNTTVRLLLSLGADPNIQDRELNTALHWAAYSGSTDIMLMFINAGCDIEATNEHGDRPLHIAARQDHYECLIILLSRGSDSQARNNESNTPLDCCVEEDSQVALALKVNQHLRALRALQKHKAEELLHRDLAKGKENTAMPVVNREDNEPYPTDFVYVAQNIETTPINVNYTITSLQHCICTEDCGGLSCACSRNSIKCWYTSEGRLLDNFNHIEPPLIFECNKACSCWSNCSNRVVQHGITARMQIFRTVGRGWGVRTLLDIPKGSFVCEYVGEHISDAEADSREDDSYLFDLDNKDSDTFCIDARRYGNIARFINHLCEPNLTPVKVFVEHQDLRFPRICFFANRDIREGEELGFDYGEKFWIIKYKQFTCACGSSKCKYSNETIHQTVADFNKRQQEEAQDQ